MIKNDESRVFFITAALKENTDKNFDTFLFRVWKIVPGIKET